MHELPHALQLLSRLLLCDALQYIHVQLHSFHGDEVKQTELGGLAPDAEALKLCAVTLSLSLSLSRDGGF